MHLEPQRAAHTKRQTSSVPCVRALAAGERPVHDGDEPALLNAPGGGVSRGGRHSPLLGDSWLKRMPLEMCMLYASRYTLQIQKAYSLAQPAENDWTVRSTQERPDEELRRKNCKQSVRVCEGVCPYSGQIDVPVARSSRSRSESYRRSQIME